MCNLKQSPHSGKLFCHAILIAAEDLQKLFADLTGEFSFFRGKGSIVFPNFLDVVRSPNG